MQCILQLFLRLLEGEASWTWGHMSSRNCYYQMTSDHFNGGRENSVLMLFTSYNTKKDDIWHWWLNDGDTCSLSATMDW